MIIYHKISTNDLEGLNQLNLFINPDNAQPEQYLFNNKLYKTFFVQNRTTVNTTELINAGSGNNWSFYPNPTHTDKVNIQFQTPVSQNEFFQIIDLKGQVRQDFMIRSGNKFHQVLIKDLSNGIYFIRNQSSKKYSTKKLLIIHN